MKKKNSKLALKKLLKKENGQDSRVLKLFNQRKQNKNQNQLNKNKNNRKKNLKKNKLNYHSIMISLPYKLLNPLMF